MRTWMRVQLGMRKVLMLQGVSTAALDKGRTHDDIQYEFHIIIRDAIAAATLMTGSGETPSTHPTGDPIVVWVTVPHGGLAFHTRAGDYA